MKKTALLLIAVVALFGSCRIETAKDLGPETTRTITTQAFDKLVISISTDVEYVPSDTFSVTITGSEKALDRVGLTVANRTLHITQDGQKEEKNVEWVINNGGVAVSKIVVHAPSLTCVNLAGSACFTCNKAVKTPELELRVIGSGDIEMADVEADDVKVGVAGSGIVNAHLARTATTTVDVAGSGDVSLKLAGCGSVAVGITGSGYVTLSGNAQTLKQSVTGSGVIDTDNLKLTK